MRSSNTAAALLLLPSASMAEYVPHHKRFSYDPLINDFSYLGMLSKRDECSDAFGRTARNSNCAPDFTLCCTRDGQAYPSCEKYIGHGWCCVNDGDDDGCYLDKASDCNAAGAVSCSKLASGTNKACCPEHTYCDEGQEARAESVRCLILRKDLLALAKKSEDATKSTSVASSTTAISTTATEPSKDSAATTAPPITSATTETAAPKESDSSSSSGISGGVIGGIVVGAVAAIALIAGLIWFFVRRNKKSKYQAASQVPQPTIAQYYEGQHSKYQQQHNMQQGGYYSQNGTPLNGGYSLPHGGGYVYGGQSQLSELSSQVAPSELPSEQPPAELDSGRRRYEEHNEWR